MSRGSFSEFVALFSRLDATTSSDARIEAIATYLSRADPADAAWAVTLLSGRRSRRPISSRRLRLLAFPLTGLPAWLAEECYAHVGDGAEVVALLCAGATTPDDVGALDEGSAARDAVRPPDSLAGWMEQFLPRLARAGEAEQRAAFARLWRDADLTTALVINKLCTGALRLGVSQKSVVRALERVSGLDGAVIGKRLTGWKEPSASSYLALIAPGASALDAGAAYPFFLASPLASLDELDEPLEAWLIEWKWDGIRIQLIRRGGSVTLWSRGEETINASFPDLERAATVVPEGVVIDGELLARDRLEGPPRPAPFASLQRRLGRKKPSHAVQREQPVYVNCYDLIEHEGRDIRSSPIEERRSLLARILGALPAEAQQTFVLSEPVEVSDRVQLERLRTGARERGVEGLMLKRRGSPYRSGRRRGDWWKFKADPYTLDAVLIYAQAGSGKRANLFTDYTFALWSDEGLVPFARAYSGLDNREIAELDRWIRRNTTERYGPARAVRPELVFEIAFEGIARSARHASGIAVRFPRIVRTREDKRPEDADTLARAHEILAETERSR